MSEQTTLLDPELSKVNTRLLLCIDEKQNIELGFYTSGAPVAVRAMNDDLAWKFAQAVRLKTAELLEYRIGSAEEAIKADGEGLDKTSLVWAPHGRVDPWNENKGNAKLMFVEGNRTKAAIKFTVSGTKRLHWGFQSAKREAHDIIGLNNIFASCVRNVVKDVLADEIKRLQASMNNIDLINTQLQAASVVQAAVMPGKRL